MEKLRAIAARATSSIERIANLPGVLVTKALSATGITRAITRAAAKAIRKDRLMRASIILVSLEVGFLVITLVLMSLALARVKSKLELANVVLRVVLIALVAGSTLHLRYNKVVRRHRLGAERRAVARIRRRGADFQ